MMQHDNMNQDSSFTSTPSLGLLAMQCSQASGLHFHHSSLDQSLSEILEDDSSNASREYSPLHFEKPKAASATTKARTSTTTIGTASTLEDSVSSLHLSFEESLNICFGDDQEEQDDKPAPKERLASLDKSIDSLMVFDKSLASLAPQLESHFQQKRHASTRRQRGSHTTTASPLDQSSHHMSSSGGGSNSQASLSLHHLQKSCEIRFIPEDVRKERSSRLERSLKLFSPFKSQQQQQSQQDIVVPMLVSPPQSPESLMEMSGNTTAMQQHVSPGVVLSTEQEPSSRSLAPIQTGRVMLKDGRIFQGKYRGKHQWIQGTMHYEDGTLYRGGWNSEGRRHGHGVVEYPDGSHYRGNFENGDFHGHGTLTWTDGGFYVGNWVQGEMQGPGKEVRSNGSIRHDGNWHQGRPIRNRASSPLSPGAQPLPKPPQRLMSVPVISIGAGRTSCCSDSMVSSLDETATLDENESTVTPMPPKTTIPPSYSMVSPPTKTKRRTLQASFSSPLQGSSLPPIIPLTSPSRRSATNSTTPRNTSAASPLHPMDLLKYEI